VNDIIASMNWYRDALGFTVDQQNERDGKLRSVRLVGGAVRILLNQEDGAKGLDRVKGQGMSFYITTEQSVDELAERIKSHGAKLDVEPADMPWGVRMISLRDPDGFKLVIAKPLAAA
jgi:uncharacterized glyoxalase superfamily protein PhnB